MPQDPATLMDHILQQSPVLVGSWTPLLIYLWRRWPNPQASGVFRAWIAVLFLSNSISLVIGYVDILRHFAGDGALPS